MKLHLPKPVWDFINFELLNYKTTKLDIENAYRDVIYASKVADGMPRGSETSDTTAQKAYKLLNNATLLQMQNTVNAIERALERLDVSHGELFHYHYTKALPWQTAALEIKDDNGIKGISQATFFRRKRELVCVVAEQLGLYKKHA